MTEVVRPYRGVSAQQRRDDRRARLLAAGLDAVGEHGVAALTVEALCLRAGLSKRYFYESFADRDALLLAALDDVFAAVRDAIGAALQDVGDDVPARIRGTVEALVRTLDDDRRAARLYVEAVGLPALRLRRDAAVNEFGALLLGAVLGVAVDDPAAQLAALVVVGGTTDAVSRWLGGAIAASRDAVVEQLTALGVAVAATLTPR